MSGHLRRPGVLEHANNVERNLRQPRPVAVVHLFISAGCVVFCCTCSANVTFRKLGNVVRFSRHGPVNWQIRASSTRGGHSRRVQGSRPVWEVVVVPCALVDLSCADHSRVDCWWDETLELVQASWATLVCKHVYSRHRHSTLHAQEPETTRDLLLLRPQHHY